MAKKKKGQKKAGRKVERVSRVAHVEENGLNRHTTFSLVVFGVLVLSILAAAFLFNNSAKIFASAPESGVVKSTVFDPIADMFSKWTAGQTSVNVAKYAFIVLLVMIIYSLLEFLPFIKKQQGYIKWPVALIIGFLAGAYLTPSDVYTMLTAYGALGIVIGGIIPFMIIAFFSVELGKKSALGGKAISILIWIAFIIFLGIKVITGISENIISAWEGVIYLILVVGGIIFILAYNKIISYIYNQGIKEGMRQGDMTHKARLEAQYNSIREEIGKLDANSPGYEDKVNDLEKQARALYDLSNK